MSCFYYTASLTPPRLNFADSDGASYPAEPLQASSITKPDLEIRERGSVERSDREL